MKFPLHHNTPLMQKTESGRRKARKRRAHERVDFWQTMHDINPNGFRSAPTSRKNPDYHKKHPVTKLERLYKSIA